MMNLFPVIEKCVLIALFSLLLAGGMRYAVPAISDALQVKLTQAINK